MVYFKAVLDNKRERVNGVYPIVFRVTFNRKNSTLSTGLRVNFKDWDNSSCRVKRSNPNAQVINKHLAELNVKIQKVAMLLEENEEFTFENLRHGLNKQTSTITSFTTFKSFSDQVIKEFKEDNRVGNAVVYQTAVNRLVNFVGNEKFDFKEIDFNLLEHFKRQLLKDKAKPNTIGNYLRSIRAIYNKAIKAKLIDRKFYPFTDISIRTEKTAKRAVASDALTGLKNIELKAKSKEWHARNYLFLSYSLIGISFTDLAYLRKEDLKAGRIKYQRRKTHKRYNIKLTKVGSSILSLYRNDSKYLLPVLNNVEENSANAKKVIQQWIKTTNKYLKRLGNDIGLENLTTYVARHTWATTAKRLGYSNEMIAEAMGHEYGNKITNIYLDSFDQELIDEMNSKVVSIIS